MPAAAICPSCGDALSQASVLAVAPVCRSCGSVLIGVGGSLGLTAAYGLNDSTLTRRRIEADLAIFTEYKGKYAGMTEVCRQQLAWSVERYATIPPQPVMLRVRAVPPFWSSLIRGIAFAAGWVMVCVVAGGALSAVSSLYLPLGFTRALMVVLFLGALAIFLVLFLSGPISYFGIRRLNGSAPAENARRLKAHERAVQSAMNSGLLRKQTEDHRLRQQIIELEGLMETVTRKEAEVRQLLRTI